MALWLIPLSKAVVIYKRYFLNGTAVWLVLIAAVIVVAWESKKRHARITAALLILLGSATLILNIRRDQFEAQIVKDEIAEGHGFDFGQTRVRASLAVIALHKEGGFSDTVLVDQHAYIDLRQIRLAGLTPRYVNLLNAAHIFAGLDPAQCYLVMFSDGTYTLPPGWDPYIGWWSVQDQRRYDSYLASLKAMPLLVDIPGKRQRVISGQSPVEPDDRMSVATTCRTPQNARAAQAK